MTAPCSDAFLTKSQTNLASLSTNSASSYLTDPFNPAGLIKVSISIVSSGEYTFGGLVLNLPSIQYKIVPAPPRNLPNGAVGPIAARKEIALIRFGKASSMWFRDPHKFQTNGIS